MIDIRNLPRPNYRKIVISIVVLGVFGWMAYANPFASGKKQEGSKTVRTSRYEELTPKQRIQEHLEAHLEAGKRFELKEKNGVAFAEIYDERNEMEGLYFETFGLKEVKGYNGPVCLGVNVSPDGTLNSVEQVYSRETKAYIKRINRSGYYNQYIGMSLKSPNNRVDALSGATITTVCVAKTLEGAVPKAAEAFLNDYVPGLESFKVTASLNTWWYLHLGVVAFLLLLSWPGLVRKRKWLRWSLYLFSVGYLGFFLNNAFSYVVLLQPFWGTTLSKMIALYSLLVILGAIWGKNVYCKWVCPFGNMQRIAASLSPFTPGKLSLSAMAVERIRYMISLVLVGGVIIGMRSWSGYELFPDLFGVHVESFWFWLSLVVVLVSLKFPNLWCRVTCPSGCLLDSLDKIASTKPKIEKTVAEEMKSPKFMPQEVEV